MTLLLAISISIIIIFSKPFNGLLLYYISLVWYPTSNTIYLGTLNFSVSRITILALIIKILLDNSILQKYSIKTIDKCMILYFVGQLFSGLFTTNFITVLTNRSGFFFDVFLPFIAIRLIIDSREKLTVYINRIVWITVPLGLITIFESYTHCKNILSFGMIEGYADPRWGMKRARATFSHPIYYGIFMSIILSLGMIKFPKNKFLLFAIFCGVFSSLSSGPWLCAITCIFIMCLYRFRYKWKTIIIVTSLTCLTIEIISNRHFYNVIDRFALNSQTAWYRTRLFEVALFENGMSGHWLFGYGFNDPMWCKKIDGRNHTDMVNHYLLILSQFGLSGLIPFLLIIMASLKNIYYNCLFSLQSDHWLRWVLGATLIGLLFSLNSVSLFGQASNFIFILFALTAPLEKININTNRTNIKR